MKLLLSLIIIIVVVVSNCIGFEIIEKVYSNSNQRSKECMDKADRILTYSKLSPYIKTTKDPVKNEIHQTPIKTKQDYYNKDLPVLWTNKLDECLQEDHHSFIFHLNENKNITLPKYKGYCNTIILFNEVDNLELVNNNNNNNNDNSNNNNNNDDNSNNGSGSNKVDEQDTQQDDQISNEKDIVKGEDEKQVDEEKEELVDSKVENEHHNHHHKKKKHNNNNNNNNNNHKKDNNKHKHKHNSNHKKDIKKSKNNNNSNDNKEQQDKDIIMDRDCENIKIVSYRDGVCLDEDSISYEYRCMKDGTVAQYKCSNCNDERECEFNKLLDKPTKVCKGLKKKSKSKKSKSKSI